MHDGDFRLTPNQNLIIANIPAEKRTEIRLDRERGRAAGALVGPAPQFHGLRRAADLRPRAGRERALSARSDRRRSTSGWPRTGCRADDIVIRMTGCPNGCARPYLAEIGLVGKGPGPLQPLSRRRLRRLAAVQALCRGSRARRHRRRARSAVRGLCGRAAEGRALRRFHHPRRLCRRHRQRPRLPRQCRPDGPRGAEMSSVQHIAALHKFSTATAAIGSSPGPCGIETEIISVSYGLARSLLLCSVDLAAAGRTVLRTNLGDRHNRESGNGLCEASRRRQRHARNWAPQARPVGRRLLIRGALAGSILAAATSLAITGAVQTGQPLVGALIFPGRPHPHRAARPRSGHRQLRPAAAAMARTRRQQLRRCWPIGAWSSPAT